MDTQKIINTFKQHKGIGFIAFPYKNKEGEISKRLVNIGSYYENALKKDIDTLNEGIEYIPSSQYTYEIWLQAIQELKESILKSLNPNNTDARSTAQKDAYVHLTNGLKWHVESSKMYIWGQTVRKTVTEEIEYKEVKSSSKTIAKNTIRNKYLRSAKYRSFIVDNLQGNIKINNNTIEID